MPNELREDDLALLDAVELTPAETDSSGISEQDLSLLDNLDFSEQPTSAPVSEPVQGVQQNDLALLDAVDLDTTPAPVEQPKEEEEDTGFLQAAKNLGSSVVDFGKETVQSIRRANVAEDAAEQLGDILDDLDDDGSVNADTKSVRGYARLLKARQDLGENRAIQKIISSDNAAQALQNLIDNPSGLTQVIIEQYPDLAEELTAQLGGGIVGGAAGTFVAPGPGTAVGAVGGSIATSAPVIHSNVKRSYFQGQIQRHLAANKLEFTDENIVDFINSEEGKVALDKASTYANVITTGSAAANLIGAGAVTSTSAKIAGKLGLELVEQGGKVVVKEGVKKKAIDFVGATGAELAGEVLASKAVGDEISAGELLLELGTAGIEAAGDVATSRISTNINRGTDDGQTASGGDTQQSNNVNESGETRTDETGDLGAVGREAELSGEARGTSEVGERGSQGEGATQDGLGDNLDGITKGVKDRDVISINTPLFTGSLHAKDVASLNPSLNVSAKAIFLTDNEKQAKAFGLDRDNLDNNETNILRAQVTVSDVFDFSNASHIDSISKLLGDKISSQDIAKMREGDYEVIESDKVQQAILDNGYDAFLVKEDSTGEINIGVFDTANLKETKAPVDLTIQDKLQGISKVQIGGEVSTLNAFDLMQSDSTPITEDNSKKFANAIRHVLQESGIQTTLEESPYVTSQYIYFTDKEGKNNTIRVSNHNQPSSARFNYGNPQYDVRNIGNVTAVLESILKEEGSSPSSTMEFIKNTRNNTHNFLSRRTDKIDYIKNVEDKILLEQLALENPDSVQIEKLQNRLDEKKKNDFGALVNVVQGRDRKNLNQRINKLKKKILNENKTTNLADRTAETTPISQEESGQERPEAQSQTGTEEIQTQQTEVTENETTESDIPQTDPELESIQEEEEGIQEESGDTRTEGETLGTQQEGERAQSSEEGSSQQIGEPALLDTEESKDRIRKFSERLSSDERIPEDVKSELKEDVYKPISNQITYDEVKSQIDNNGITRSIRELTDLSSDLTLAQRITIGQVIVDNLNKASFEAEKASDFNSKNDIDETIVDVVEFISEQGTRAGQGIQAFTIWNRLSENGLLLSAQRELNRVRRQNEIGKGIKKIIPKKIPIRISNNLKKIHRENKKLLNEGNLSKNAQIVQAMKVSSEIAKLSPDNFLDKLRNAQTIAMLGNPLTQVRNIAGNIFSFLGNSASDFISVPIDKGVSLITNKRTRRSIGKAQIEKIKGLSEPVKVFKEGVNISKKLGYVNSKGDYYNKLKFGVDAINKIGRALSAGRLEINTIREIGGNTFSSKTGKLFEGILTFVMSTPDIAAFQAEYNSKMRQRLDAKNLELPDKQTLEEVQLDAMKAIYQDNSRLAKGTTQLKHLLNSASTFGATSKFGLGEIILKFARVPANLITRGIEFSPGGFINSLYQTVSPVITKRDFDQKEFVDSFSSALVGTTGLFGVGYFLQQLGIIIASEEDDPDLRALNRERGITAYQINASALKRAMLSGNFFEKQEVEQGDVLSSFDWAQPLAFPMVMGADLGENLSKNKGAKNTILSSFSSGIRSLENQPLLQGLFRTFDNISFAARKADKTNQSALLDVILSSYSDIPVTFIPTVSGQIRRMKDENIRETFTDNLLDSQINRIKNKIPGLSSTLPTKKSVLTGEPLTYENQTLMNVFLNPAITRTFKEDKVLDELTFIYSQQGDDKLFPRKIKNKVRISKDGKIQSIQLTNEQKSEMQEFTSKVTYAILNDVLVNNKRVPINLAKSKAKKNFASMDTEQQTEYIARLLSNVYTASKITMLGHSPKTVNKATKEMVKELEGFALDIINE